MGGIQDACKKLSTRVSTDGCEYVDDFINTLNARPLLAIPEDSTITLFQLRDGKEVEIKPTAALKSLQDVGKDGGAPLIVKPSNRAFVDHCEFAHLCS